jgi:GTP-binding protein
VKIKSADFVISAVSPAQYPEDNLPEIAFAGRSNVGKSSLINMLVNRKKMARTSSTPGKTQTINFYRINELLYFVDLQGYGYAKVSKKSRATWGKSIMKYLAERQMLMNVFLLVDIRHKPSEHDKTMFDWIKGNGYRGIVLVTKTDKIPRSRKENHLKVIRQTLGMEEDDVIIPISTKTKEGLEEVWNVIEDKMAEFGIFEE